MALPLLLDTDIGTDIDDAYALALAAVSPELDLRAVTTVNHDVELRAKIAKALLGWMGRDDIPVAPGCSVSLTPGVDRGWMGHEGRGIDLACVAPEDLSSRAASDVIADCARAAHEVGAPLTVVTIGALTNLATALRSRPSDIALVGRVIAMASDFVGYGSKAARGEHNVACDPLAFDVVVRSGLPVTLVGLNVTNQTRLDRVDAERIGAIGGPLAAALLGMHRVWFDAIHRDHSPMHDGLAVALALRPDLVTLEPVEAHTQCGASDGGTVAYERASEGAPVRIAVGLDADAFRALLLERVSQAVSQSANAKQLI